MAQQARKAFQDYYPDDVAHCYGCGRLNERGHQVKSYWDGDETVARFTPQPYHTAIPGFVYEAPRFVTASLSVDYLRPTPLGPELEIRGRVKEATARKVVVETTLSAEGEVTASGTVIAVRMPEGMVERGGS